MGRRILRVDGGQISVATEARFALEAWQGVRRAAIEQVAPGHDESGEVVRPDPLASVKPATKRERLTGP